MTLCYLLKDGFFKSKSRLKGRSRTPIVCGRDVTKIRTNYLNQFGNTT